MYKQPVPILRDLEAEHIKHNLMKLFNVTAINYPYKNCLNCKNWNEKSDICGRYNARPPTEIIVYSCPDHDDNDEIPF